MKPSLYGKYAGILKYDAEYIKNCSEMELFIQVNAYYEPVHRYNELLALVPNYIKMKEFYEKHDDNKAAEYFEDLKTKLANKINKAVELTSKRTDEVEYAMDFCILQTAKFGTNVSYNPNGRVILTEEFKAWYENWKLYVESMDNNVLEAYRRYRYQGKSLENFKTFAEQITSTGASIDEDNYKMQKQKSIKQEIA